jgi:hypothetical protein
MFKKIVIHLTEPVCLCLEQNLTWTTVHTASGPSLAVWCNDCSTRLEVPNREFKALFYLDYEYPGKPLIKPPPKSEGLADVINMQEYMRRKVDGPPS